MEQMNAFARVVWESFVELNRIATRSFERATLQEIAFMRECAATAVAHVQALTQAKDMQDALRGETRFATECGEKWMANTERVVTISLQAQNELGHWATDALRHWHAQAGTTAEQAQRIWPWAVQPSWLDVFSLDGDANKLIVDDPMLALMTRFVCGETPLHLSEGEFILDQIATIQRYVARFPAEQRNARALEWVEHHAERYRQAWQKKALYAQATRTRCPDCPLSGDGAGSCEIHDRWLQLLNRYMAGEVSSRWYVESTLYLLSQYKSQLKVSAPRETGVSRAPLTSDAA